jgi:phage-related minor tail protein
MAGKSVALSIVLSTVDKATAGLRAFNARLAAATAPVRDLGEKLKGLGEEAGVGKLVEGFKGVGGAVKDLFGKLLVIGGVAAAAVFGLKSLVDEFANLGNTAKRIGTTVDFLAAMRFAASKSGASVEQLDQGLQSFTANLGQARAGTGRMAKFLGLVSPALLTQLKATQSNEEAFKLLADAMAKVQDPAKRLALAQKTVGDVALAPLLARGSKGLLELQGEYAALAGSQEEAAASAGEAEEAMKDLGAATDGIKGALVQGLAPALKEIVEQIKDWLVGHREDVRRWAEDLGKKLPDAVRTVASVISSAVSTVLSIVDAIGGIKTVAIAAAAILVGPLVSSLFTLGAALLTTPVGWIILGITAIILAGYELIKHWDAVGAWFRAFWDRFGGIITAAFPFIVIPIRGIIALVQTIIAHWDPIKAFFAALWDDVKAVFAAAWDYISPIVDKITGAVDWITNKVGKLGDFIQHPFGGDDAPAVDAVTLGTALGAGAAQATEARIKVDFTNAPPGTRVTADPANTGDVDLTVGHQFFGVGA